MPTPDVVSRPGAEGYDAEAQIRKDRFRETVLTKNRVLGYVEARVCVYTNMCVYIHILYIYTYICIYIYRRE